MMSLMKNLGILTATVTTIGFATTGEALALKKILPVEKALGFENPSISTDGSPVYNGDFLIKPDPFRPIVGDGVDEETTWTFDFSPVKNVKSVFQAGLILDLTPKSSLIDTDEFKIDGLKFINTDIIHNLEVGKKQDVFINLLDFYSSSQLTKVFNENKGKLPFVYRDDAIVSRAELSLGVDVPEPASVVSLFAVGVLGTGSLLKRKQKKGNLGEDSK
ncbi:PEP-CTERM sorting domain-containing protein [Lusitaniella coriacea LEGE 07157]|uniref:PEP-CTERM sorting domain-containing protein n=1 Tax=Lusitaniella coriacea LEGE 07157 TaxID=945747 RepID=A0A8J7AW67_9CYAN|nr:PEP-CTERM sorting domain-containing protein [Lusitaniella coriacea]MBE9114462.1 PEP-CTERM sorting domain-containing protein [Lusitaniella coriacea LEGE 07157]